MFFLSGLTKLHDWSITLALFRNEYHVPLLPPRLRRCWGRARSWDCPSCWLWVLGTRFAAVALFAFNIVAVISYPDLSAAGLKDHVLWGALLLVLFFYGPESCRSITCSGAGST